MDKLAEVAGFGLILTFAWFLWPPLPLLGGGLLLVLYANTRTRSGRVSAVVSAAVAAARNAYVAARPALDDTTQLRRVA